MSFFKNILSSLSNTPQSQNIINQKLTFETRESSEYKDLNKIIKGIKINSKIIEDYSEYINEIENLINPKNIFSSELEYRFSKLNNNPIKNSEKKISEIEMMIKVGKIGKKETQLDEKSSYEKIKFQNNFKKIESQTNFASIRANNCIFKGKWCYEVNLITNGLMQIGFCQLNTDFKRNEGVGDDKTSFAFDGFRQVIWNKDNNKYGNLWDIGDIIGVCIDLDNHKMEFFINGKKLGDAFVDLVSTGENIAYFPAISLSQGEKCNFNFGYLPFHFDYQGYQSFDIPLSQVNGFDKITQQILNILDSDIFNILINDNVSNYNKINVSYLIFDFLINVAFNDIFIIKIILLPYLIKLSQDQIKFKLFFDYLIGFIPTKEKKLQLVKFFFDIFSNIIEEYALMGEKKIDEWIKHFRLFKSILYVESIVNIWIESGTIETLKNIFSSNFFRFPDFYEYLLSKNRFSEPTKTVYESVNEIKTEFFDNNESIHLTINEKFTNEMSDLLYFILTDKRKFINDIILKDKLNELIKNGFGLSQIEELLNVIGGYPNQGKEEPLFFKNIYYPVINIFIKDYINISFDKLSTEPWFNRQDKESIYYDDVGIGGTISSVTTEYISNIDNKFTIKNNEFYAHFFHQIIKMGDDLFINQILKRFEKTRAKNKNILLSNLVISSHGNRAFENVFRRDFYLFNLHSQILFYKFSYFIIKFIMWLKEQNKDILYFIPNCVIELPFALFKTLVKLHSKILSEPEFRKKINEGCVHFKNDDYIKNIFKLYLYLFADNKIRNPELRENLLTKVNFLTKKQNLMKFFDEEEEFFDNLIKGLLNDMTGDALSHYACRVLLKIIAPICFGKENESNNKKLVSKIQKYFSGNQEILNDFLKNYSKFINQVMTEYTINLSNITGKYKNGLKDVPIQTKLPLLQAISSSYNLMCDLLKINEFFIVIYPNFFLDINSLNYSHLVNIIKNLGARILSSPYIDQLINIGNELDKIYKELEAKNNINNNEMYQKRRINLLNLGYSTVGIFLKLYKNKDKGNYAIFANNFANISDIRFEPFKNLYKMLKKNVTDAAIKPKIEEYYTIILSLEKLRNIQDLSDEQMDKLIEKNELCIICYEHLSNMEILPCKHSACEDCLRQYMNDKDICFICHHKIESTKKIQIKEDLNKMDIDN